MAEQKIEFLKVRDLGENLNDTLVFIRQNFGPLLKSFFAISAVLMVIQAIYYGMYQSQTFSFLDSVLRGGSTRQPTFGHMFSGAYFVLILLKLVTIVVMQVSVGAYIKWYKESDGKQASIEEVWQLFKRYFFKVLFYSIPVYLLTFAGVLLCLLPGIWLGIVFVPFTLVIMIEDRGFLDSFHRCFELVKDNFLTSFATYLVGYLLYTVGWLSIGAVTSVIFGLGAYLTTKDLSGTIGVITSFFDMFSSCFYIIFFICVTFNYFTLAERLDGTGILRRISNIGTDHSKFDNVEEQY